MPTEQEILKARIAELEKALAAKNAPKAISFKVSEKGAVSAYGINARFPVTLYADQWVRLSAAMPALGEFIKANASSLSVKPANHVTTVPPTK